MASRSPAPMRLPSPPSGPRWRCTSSRCCARRASPSRPNDDNGAPMFNLASLIIGLVALVLAIVAFIPLLGWANWLIIPLAIIGAVVGMVSRSTAGRNLNLFVIVIGVIRLMLGGGIL